MKKKQRSRARARRKAPPLRVHWLQHADHEGLGCIGPWLARRGYRMTATRLQRGERLPAVRDFDWLIVMGGPMNIYEHDRYPWLAEEKVLIRDACVTHKKILGICLGAQLLADVLGAKVTRNDEAEIGWFPVELTEEGRDCQIFETFPEQFDAFHWHGDTFSLPKAARNLIKSDACVNQAFVLGRQVGLQFHLEVRAADVKRWLGEDTPAPGRHVQSGEEMLREPARFRLNNRLMRELLDRMAELQ